MVILLAALLPIFSLIMVGYLLRRKRFPELDFWGEAERLTYYLLFPALLVNNTANAELNLSQGGRLAMVLIAGTLLMSLLALLLRSRWLVEGHSFSSLFQGTIRFNTYVGLAVTYALYGEIGLSWAALALVILIPLVNLLCVGVLLYLGNSSRPKSHQLVRELLSNPLILACLMGFALNLSGFGLPSIVSDLLRLLGQAALPLGLLAVGAGLRLSALHRDPAIWAYSGLKLLIFPAVVVLLTLLLGMTGTPAAVAVLFAALPGAPSAYILARQMGGDAQLMARIITLQTLVATLTLPIVLSAVQKLGAI